MNKQILWPCFLATVLGVAVAETPFPVSAMFDAGNLTISVNTGGSYSIGVGKTTWLYSAPTFFRNEGKMFTSDRDLVLNSTTAASGIDIMGRFQLTSFTYYAGKSKIGATIKTYNKWPVVIFWQVYENGANRTRAENVNYVISGFPVFNITSIQTETGPLGYLAYGGMMLGDTEKSFGLFQEGLSLKDGLAGGPIAIFDRSGNTMVISPASQFMAASNWKMTGEDRLAFGIMGGVDTVPPEYSMEFIVYYSSQGVNRALEDWGWFLRKAYGRTDSYVKQDWTINYLGYWTDNGAYYYYNTENNKTYQDTMLDIKAYADNLTIPYRYYQYDSWWYYKGVGDGVKTWEARPDIFPKGFDYVQKQLGSLPASAHNRYWASDTSYAKQNGGQYNFIVEPEKAVPNDQSFWNDLLANASKSWGLYTYEQDWLNKEFSGVDALLSDIDLGATWLNQMAKGALNSNLTIQYCMANSRHIMQALLNSVVTQARASDDYSPGSDQWKIGVSSMFAYAMGIAPYKDNFWTTKVQPGNPYSRQEPNNELQTAVSVLSTGPVGPSDMIGHTNVTLLMRCCRTDGLILKPSKPVTAVDDQIYRKAFGSSYPGPDGEVWTTYSSVSGLIFGIIFVPEIHNNYSITPQQAGFGQMSPSKVFSLRNITDAAEFNSDSPLEIRECNPGSPCLYYVTPVLRQKETLILGELNKFVPVSPQRFLQIEVNDDVTVRVTGAPNERSPITFLVQGEIVTIECTFPESGKQTISVDKRSCS